MEQSRIESLLEAVANQAVGMSYAILFYWFLFDFTIIEGLSTTAFFSVAGLTRVYFIRRGAVYLSNKRNKA